MKGLTSEIIAKLEAIIDRRKFKATFKYEAGDQIQITNSEYYKIPSGIYIIREVVGCFYILRHSWVGEFPVDKNFIDKTGEYKKAIHKVKKWFNYSWV